MRNICFFFQMVGVMLLQYLLFNAISEVATASIIIHWAIKALYQPEHSEEGKSFHFCLADQDGTVSVKNALWGLKSS